MMSAATPQKAGFAGFASTKGRLAFLDRLCRVEPGRVPVLFEPGCVLESACLA